MLRLTARTLKTVFRSSLLFKRMPSIAMFCTDKTPTPKEETPSSKLANHLKEEIAYEKENAPKVNDSLELMKKQGWTVKAEGTMIDMTKTVGNKTIHIVFSARSPPPEDPTEEENKKGEEEPDSDFNELTVYILKEGSNKVMFADFITSQGQMNIMTLGFTKDFEQHKRTTKLERSPEIYGGPDLNTLDEELIKGFEAYLTTIGINEKVVSFIDTYSIDAEHQHYVKWLEDIKKFVE